MSLVTVGIGEWAVSNAPDEILKTYGLGSCVAVMIYDSRIGLAGLIHVSLPDSSIDKGLALAEPGRFADLGLPLMIEEMKARGADRRSVWVKLAGGASIMDPNNHFDIGRRNVLAVKRVLWKSTLGPIAEDIGGETSRTVSFSAGSGVVTISSGGRSWEL